MRILIFTGPSGGHLFPALAFMEYFSKKHPNAENFLVVSPRVKPFLEKASFVPPEKIFYLEDFSFPRIFSLKAFSFLLKLAKGFVETRKIFKEVKPDAVAAFGTFVGFPGVVLGSLKKIPVVLHEQNIVPGRANQMSIPFATKVAVTFPSTLKSIPSQKGIWVGNILRPAMVIKAQTAREREEKLRILILGGSQGASLLNQKIFDTFRQFTAEEKKKIAVIHITGISDLSNYEFSYEELGIENQVYGFTDHMPELYSRTDLVIARAGAGTVAELALFGLPSVLVPYPHAASHQLQNAHYLADEGAALIVEEKDLSPERLKEHLLALMGEPDRLERMSRNALRLAKPDAGERLVEEVENLLSIKGGLEVEGSVRR